MKIADSPSPQPDARHIAMHLHGTARTDARVLREAVALVGVGYAVTIVDTDPDVSRSRVELFEGIKLIHVRMPDSRSMRWLKRNKASRLAWLLIQNVRALLALRVDVYHAHDANTLLATYVAARIHRKSLVFDAHELPYSQRYFAAHRLQLKFNNALLRWMMPSANAVVTVSEPIADEIQRRYGGPHAILVRNIPPYQQPITSNRLRERLQLPPQTRIALYQGNLQEDRSLDVLVRAARFLSDNIILVLMGDGPSKAALEALIASEGVGEHVQVLPAVPYAELLSWTASADLGLILLSPDFSLSIRYCLPNKLFEYLMAGLPVLSSQLPAVAEVLERYDAGQISPSLEPEVVAQAIAAMLADWKKLARLHANTLAAARELNWEDEQATLLDLYERLLHMQFRVAMSEVAH